jgi:hypothetical protein
MGEKYSISYNQACPRDPRLFCFNSRLGFTYANHFEFGEQRNEKEFQTRSECGHVRKHFGEIMKESRGAKQKKRGWQIQACICHPQLVTMLLQGPPSSLAHNKLNAIMAPK